MIDDLPEPEDHTAELNKDNDQSLTHSEHSSNDQEEVKQNMIDTKTPPPTKTKKDPKVPGKKVSETALPLTP